MSERANGINSPDLAVLDSASLAKARLLAWAERSDARSWSLKSSLGMIAVGGAAVVLGGVAVGRALAPRHRSEAAAPPPTGTARRLISWALVARAGIWLLPHVIRAIQSREKDRAPR